MRNCPRRKSNGSAEGFGQLKAASRAAKSRSDKPASKTTGNSLTDATRAHEGGEEKWPPGQIFPVCPGEARSGRNQGAKHPAAPLACASGETGPTWIRDVAVEKGTKDRNETSRNCRMQVGPALPGAHAGEFSRQARPGRRGGKRVEARAASRNPESLTGRSPVRFGRPAGRP